ncbi:MAG: formylglycine-generating enzyme family protein [Deltaproteobacteria bacterium]|nr:formylglycine-generating enzyme family protein [Deltaproteobacteria bacterium]
MASRLGSFAWMLLVLPTASLGCSSDSDAPRGQVVLYIDTDAPIASQTLTEDFKRDASVDTLRIDILDGEYRPIQGMTRIIPASDVLNWPLSFGLEPAADSKLARMRLRAFRARNAEARTDPDTKAQIYEPVAGYTIDRVVEVPLPDKGAFALRVVLHSKCRGKRPDLVRRTTCVDDPAPDRLGTYRQGIEVLPTAAAKDPNAAPARPVEWWPAASTSCDGQPFDPDRMCVSGGFFMLGNLRVVGFGALRRSDAVPAHPVVIRPFLIDRKEMTVGRWLAAVDPNPANLPVTTDQGCTAASASPNRLDLPLNCVTWNQAQEACIALGGRLPTEAEWEYVATGRGRGYLFPWSDDPPDCKSASLGHKPSSAGFEQCDALSEPEPAASYARLNGGRDETADDPAQGTAVDLAGSLSEWMFDSFRPYDADKECWERDALLVHPVCYKDAALVPEHSVRGGNWASQLEVAYASLRNNQGDAGYFTVGFRCVYPLAQQVDPLLGDDTSNIAQYKVYLDSRKK